MTKKEKLKNSSKKLAYTSGALHGMAQMPRGKVGMGLKLAGAGTSIASTVQNVRGSTGIGNFLKTELGNMLRTGAGFAGGTFVTHNASKSLKAIKNSGIAKRASKSTPAMKDVTPKNVRFARIRGRVVPIRSK